MAEHDRRAFLRVIAEFPVGWSRLSEDGSPADHRFEGTTLNVSAGGVKMLTAQPVAVGERVRMELRFSHPPFLVFTDATVLRVSEREDALGCECALQFDPLDQYIEQRLVRWVYSEDRRVADRRAAVRVPLQLIVRCQALTGGGAAGFKAGTVDIAADGTRILTEQELAVGDRIRLEIELGDPPDPMTLEGEVVWGQAARSGRWAYGIRFEGLDRRMQRLIAERAVAHERRQRGG